jgi:hypothetical protein
MFLQIFHPREVENTPLNSYVFLSVSLYPYFPPLAFPSILAFFANVNAGSLAVVAVRVSKFRRFRYNVGLSAD